MAKGKTSSGKGSKQAFPVPDSVPTESPASMVALEVHLWLPGGGAELEIPPSAIAMVTDFLSVRNGIPRGGASESLSAFFPDAVLAVKTARQLERLLRGYCSALPPGCVGAVIALMAQAELPVQIDLPLLSQMQALEVGSPVRVLLVGSLCESMRGIPGLQFRPMSGGMVSLDDQGLAREVMLLQPPSDLGEMKYEPIVPAPKKTLDSLDTEVAGGQSPVSTLGNSNIDAPRSTTSTHNAALVNSRARSTDATVERKSSMQRVVLGCVAAIVIVAVGLSLALRQPSPPQGEVHTAPPAPKQSAQPADSTAVISPVSRAGKVTVLPPTPPEKVPVSVAKSVTPQKSTGKNAAENKVSEASHARQPKVDEADDSDDSPKKTATKTVGLFSHADILELIAKAERDSGNGNYDAAISTFQTALKYEPGNVAAKAGLDKAKRNRDSR